MLIRTVAMVLTVVLALAAAGQALADSWKDESGHGRWYGRDYRAHEAHWRDHWKHRDSYRKHGHRHGHGKLEYRDGPCKIEEKWGPGGYKREIKCGHGYRHAAVDVAWLVDRAFAHAAPGESILWQDATGDGSYQVLSSADYWSSQGRYCREYQAVVTVAGRPQSSYGTACYQPDGSWQIVQ